MADTWQTIEQAAVTLRLSVRTVNRHITAGKLQSRLFEGRREVLVSGIDPESFQPRSPASGTNEPAAPEPNFTFQPGGSAAFGQRTSGSVSGTSSVAEFANGGGYGSSAARPTSDREGGQPTDPVVQDSHRQRVTPEVPSERPWDMQTMLALTDSIDDKATLAVAAYQTLARSAETQVQSLRKVALGAWAVVGVMAVGITVAVGWAAVTITSAEKSAGYLKEQLEQSKLERQKLEDHADGLERDRDAARAKTTADLEGKREADGRMAEKVKGLEEKVDRLSAVPRADVLGTRGPLGGSTVTPFGGTPAVAPAVGTPVGAPATQSARPPANAGGTSGSRPTTTPASRSPAHQNPNPSGRNLNPVFDPK